MGPPTRERVPGRLGVYALGMVCVLAASGWGWAKDLFPKPGAHVFHHYDLTHGLSQVSVECILVDRQGFMWLGTQSGLNRFDGYQFTLCEAAQEQAVVPFNAFIEAIVQDEAGTIWVGTQGDGLRCYGPDSRIPRIIQRADPGHSGLTDDQITCLAVDSHGRIWIGTRAGGLNCLDPKTNHWTAYRQDASPPLALGEDWVTALTVDARGTVWVGTESAGLWRQDATGFVRFGTASKTKEPGLRDATIEPTIVGVTSLCGDRESCLWVGTKDHGLACIDESSGSVRWFRQSDRPGSLSDDRVLAVFVDVVGGVWVGTFAGGLNYRAPGSQDFETFRHDPLDPTSLSDNRVISIGQDHAQMMWIGTYYGGVNTFSPGVGRFARYGFDPNDPRSLSRDTVRYIYEDRKGRLWVGTDGGGINLWDDASGGFFNLNRCHENAPWCAAQPIRCIYDDRDGTLWWGTDGEGLYGWNEETGARRAHRHDPSNPQSLSHDRVYALLEHGDGLFWVGTFGGGLNVLDRDTGRFERVRHDPANDATSQMDFVRSLIADEVGDVWLGTWNGLIWWDHVTARFSRCAADPEDSNSLSADMVSALFLDDTPDIWVGTWGGGLNRGRRDEIKRGAASFEHFGLHTGLPSNVISGILKEDSGALWLSTLKGITRFDPNTGELRHFDSRDGLQSNGFNAGVYCRRKSGEMLFGGPSGLNAFFPDKMHYNRFIPPVVLTSFRKFNEEVQNEQWPSSIRQIQLNHRDSVVSFEFAALNFMLPEKNQYAYQLEGFNDQWIDLETKRDVGFTNLDPGTYTLRVRGSNNDGFWNRDGLTLDIHVAPPPWLTWWAYTLYALALGVAALGYFLHYERKLERERAVRDRIEKANRRLQAVDRLKDEFLANTSHELRTPLHGIIGIVESLMSGVAGSLDPKTRANLSMVLTSAMRLFHLVNDILDFSKLKTHDLQLNLKPVDMRALTDVVLTLHRPLVREKKVSLINEIPSQARWVLGDEDRLQQIMHNLVGNALKFTAVGFVTVSSRAQDDQLEITVSDTGIGIEEEGLERIFESFEQADGSVQRLYGGTGIGLALTRKLVELHGGRIWATSQPGKGSQFRFSLPTCEPPSPVSIDSPDIAMTPAVEAMGEMSADDRRPPAPKQGQPCILIVDDEPVNRQVLVNQLSLAEYTVAEARNGPEALSLVEEGLPVDLVLLDIMMPVMSGYEVCEKLRKLFSRDTLPIILLTAKNQIADLVAGFKAGANDFLTKPIGKEELISRIDTHLTLLRSRRDLETTNRTLEQRVRERTADLEEKNRELVTLDGIVKAVNRQVELKHVLHTLLEQASILFPKAEKGAVFSCDATSRTYAIASAVGYDPDQIKDIAFSKEEINQRYLMGTTELRPGIFVRRDARELPEHRQTEHLPKPQSLVTMVLQVTGKEPTYLVFDSYRHDQAFEAGDAEKLSRFREHAESALARGVIVEELHATMENLKKTQEQLLHAAHLAGMADLATSVLHDVGNCLNSLRISSQLIQQALERDELSVLLDRVVSLIQEHRADLADFLTEDPKGVKLPDALWQINRQIWSRDRNMKQEVQRLLESLDHVQNVIQAQQAYADVKEQVEPLDVKELVRQNLAMQAAALEELGVAVQLELGDVAPVMGSKPKLLRVLNNLIQNGCDAMSDQTDAQLSVSTFREGTWVRIKVTDNGCGIPEDYQIRIFNQGFSTKAGKGGFGLHYCANVIGELGGTIEVKSDGAGCGATFIVALPVADEKTGKNR